MSTTTARGGWRRRLPFLAVLSLLLSVPIGLAVQTPAHATTTVSLFAGTGWSGYDGDEKPATTAKLWGPKDLATDAAGNVYFADKYNHIVRRIDTAGTIHLVRGTPSTAHNVYAGGLNRPAGVAITADDGTSGYIADTSNHVVVTLTGGAIWAGNDCGVGGFGGDGGPAHTSGPAGTGDPNCTQTTPSPVKLNQPSGLGFDSGTGVLYIADTNNCRIRLANGGINTVAGNGNCTSVGAGGNVGDGGPATSAQLAYPDDVAAGNGKLYIADTNNCRIRWVNLSTNVINTLVGSGSCSDGVQSPRGIVVDKVGNVYFGSQDGTVRRVNPLGTMSTVAGGLGSSVAGVTRDLAGNIYASVQFDKIYKISGYNSSATVSNVNATVTANDPLYTMDVNFNLSGVACPATARVTIGTSLTRYKPLCNAGDTVPTSGTVSAISVLSLNPETGYPLKVTVDDANGTSPVGTGTLTTPKVPVWVADGDSVSSGHHQDQDEPCSLTDFAAAQYVYDTTNPHSWSGTCRDSSGAGTTSYTPNDSTFAWATRARNQLMSQLNVPSQWQMAILVLARSGALAQNYNQPGPQDDTTCNGCGEKDATVSALQAHTGSWNIVSVTGGANDAHFGDRLSDFYTATQGQGKPWDVSSRSDCPNLDQVESDVQSTSSQVQTALTQLFAAAQTADPHVRRVAVTYPHVLNSTATCAPDSMGVTPYNGATHVVDDLDGAVTALSNTGAMVVDLRTTGFSSNPQDDIQLTRYFGYPHPNSAGQDAIATAVVGRLLS